MQRGGQHRTRSNNSKVSGAGGRGRQSEPARVHAISCDLVRSRRGSLRATRTMAAVSHRIYPVAAAVAATMAGRPVPAHDRIYPPVPPYGRPLYVGTGLDSRHAVMHRLVRPPKMRVCTQVRTCRAVWWECDVSLPVYVRSVARRWRILICCPSQRDIDGVDNTTSTSRLSSPLTRV